MARKYEPVPGSGFYCWSLEKCEEEIFIVALGEIASLIPPGQKWQRTLEYHFFELGKGLADETLIEMNGARGTTAWSRFQSERLPSAVTRAAGTRR